MPRSILFAPAVSQLLLVTTTRFSSVAALTNISSKVKHVVMFTLQDDVPEEKVEGKRERIVPAVAVMD